MAISVILLVASVNAIHNPQKLANVGRVVTSVILLIFSLGLVRYSVGYFNFATSAGRIEESVKTLAKPVEHSAILKLWQDYQLARASSPMLPSWLWKVREKKLNKLWTLYRA